MPLYKVSCVDKSRRGALPFSTTLYLSDKKKASDLSADSRFAIQSCELAPESKRGPRRIPAKELILMCKSLSRMLKAQIPLAQSLIFFSDNASSGDIAMCFRSIAQLIKDGYNPDKAFQVTGRFDNVFVGMVRAGVESNQLPSAFHSIARRMDTDRKFRKRLVRAVALPAFVMCILFAIMVFSQTSLVPQVEKLLKDMGTPPDPFTAVVFHVSHAVQACWVFLLVGMIAFGFYVWRVRAIRTALLGIMMSKWKMLRLVINEFRQLSFVGTMEMLLKNRIAVGQSLDIAAQVMKGTPLEGELKNVIARTKQGMPLGTCMKAYTTVDTPISHLIEVGEKTNTLGDQFGLLCEMYEESLDDRTEDFTQVVTTASIFVSVTTMALIYVASYLPIVLAGPKMMQGSGI